MSFIFLFLWWLIATSLGIAAIVALEPLWHAEMTSNPEPTQSNRDEIKCHVSAIPGVSRA